MKIKLSTSWIFLIIVFIFYLVLFIVNQTSFFLSLLFFSNLFLKIIHVFLIVFILMVLVDYFITLDLLLRHLKNRGVKKWILISIAGILSVGPIYMWYPLLADLKKKGLSYGLIACFLYNRAIKIPLLPFAIYYFGWKYILILTIIMIFISFIQGILINIIIER